MNQIELFKSALLELKNEHDLYLNSSFIKKLFNKNKIDNATISKKINELVTNELLNELKNINSLQIVRECFKVIDIFKDLLPLQVSLPIKKSFLETITENGILNDKERILLTNLKKIILIEEQKVKLQTEFNRVLKGGDIP